MAKYRYQGLKQGKPVEGKVEAADLWDAENKLFQQNILVEKVELHLRKRKVSLAECHAFAQAMAGMLEAGFPVKESGNFWLEQADRPETWLPVFSRLAQGESLWEILQSEKVAPPMVCAMIRMGESTGRMAFAFRQSADFLEARLNLARQVRSALSYPALVLLVSGAAISVLVFYVLPIFEEMYRRFGHELPMVTRLLLGGLDHLRAMGFLYLLLIGLAVFVYRWAGTQPTFRLWQDERILALPFAGQSVSRWVQANFSKGMASLLGAGVGLLESLELASQLVGNQAYQKRIHEARSQIITGVSPALVFEQTQLLPASLARLLRMGEETGRLAEAFQEIHHFLEQRIKSQLKKLEQFLEPLLIIGLALIIGFILVALYMPMFDLVQILDES